jgi:hypothetical protein
MHSKKRLGLVLIHLCLSSLDGTIGRLALKQIIMNEEIMHYVAEQIDAGHTLAQALSSAEQHFKVSATKLYTLLFGGERRLR